MIKPLSEKAVHTRIAGRQNLAAASNGPRLIQRDEASLSSSLV